MVLKFRIFSPKRLTIGEDTVHLIINAEKPITISCEFGHVSDLEFNGNVILKEKIIIWKSFSIKTENEQLCSKYAVFFITNKSLLS